MSLVLAHSHGALTKFENCPKRYYHERITKEVKDEGGEASVYGERVHKALELRLRDKEPLPVEFWAYERYCQALESQPVEQMLVEQELTINNKLKQTGWWDEDAWVRAKLDVLIIAEKQALIVDWKTGKPKDDWGQMEICAAMVFLCYPQVMTIRSSYVWLAHGKMSSNPRNYTRGDDQMLLLMKLFQRIRRVEGAVTNNVWPAKPSGLCGYCPARNICEFAKQPYKGRR